MSDRVLTWVRRLGESGSADGQRRRVLVPVAVLEGETLPPSTVTLLGGSHVVLLGYHEVPEQTPPGQAQLQFEERATDILESMVGDLEAAGAVVESVVAFTQSAEDTIERIWTEEDCDARLVVQPHGPLESVILAVTPELDPERVVGVTLDVLGGGDWSVTLIDAGRSVDAADVEATRRALVDAGVDEGRIEVADPEANRPVPRIVEAAAMADLVVMAEPGSDLEEALLGDSARRVAKGYVGPVLVVRPERVD
ncbi:MAG: universal stress protein [Halobacteriota archaeon]